MKDLYDDVFLYDLVHESFADAETIDFFIDQLPFSDAKVLELACGSGRILIPLAKRKVNITGLDISKEMLDLCSQKAQKENLEVKLIKGDMRNFSLNRKFDLLIIAAFSLQHLTNEKDISACFNCIKNHLAPHGKLIVEFNNPYLPLLNREPEKRYMIGEFSDYILTEDVRYDPETQINQTNRHFWHRPTNEITTLSYSLKQFFPNDLENLFSKHNFQIKQKFGDFDKSPISENSAQQIIVASF